MRDREHRRGDREHGGLPRRGPPRLAAADGERVVHDRGLQPRGSLFGGPGLRAGAAVLLLVFLEYRGQPVPRLVRVLLLRLQQPRLQDERQPRSGSPRRLMIGTVPI